MPQLLPNQLFPGLTADATGITIPYADLGGLTQAEANPTTGDGRKVMYELTNAAQNRLAAIPQANRPAKLTLAKGTPTGLPDGGVRQTFTIGVDLTISAADVSPEPA